MNACATHDGVDKRRIELYALAAGIIGKCHYCVALHYNLPQEDRATAGQLRYIGRIAVVFNAAANVLARGQPAT